MTIAIDLDSGVAACLAIVILGLLIAGIALAFAGRPSGERYDTHLAGIDHFSGL